MKMQNVIVILGPPGSGKGTQGKMLASILHYNYLSMGKYLREYSLRDTDLARAVKETIDGGKIIPDNWVEGIFKESIENLPEASGLVLDGFPRDLGQAPLLEKFLQENSVQTIKVLFLEVEKEDLVKRIAQRATEGTVRADDDPGIIHTRFEEYQTKTFPLKKYFQEKGLLIPINGNQTIEGTHKEIMNKLGLESR